MGKQGTYEGNIRVDRDIVSRLLNTAQNTPSVSISRTHSFMDGQITRVIVGSAKYLLYQSQVRGESNIGRELTRVRVFGTDIKDELSDALRRTRYGR